MIPGFCLIMAVSLFNKKNNMQIFFRGVEENIDAHEYCNDFHFCIDAHKLSTLSIVYVQRLKADSGSFCVGLKTPDC